MIYETLPVNNYVGNSSCKTFDFDFYIENEEQLKVFLKDEDGTKKELTYNIDYSINEFKNKLGSYITFPIENSNYKILNENQSLSLELNLEISQEVQYNNSSLLNLETLEYSLDYLTRLIQILNRKIELCLKVEEGLNATPDTLLGSIKTSEETCIENKNTAQEYKLQAQNIAQTTQGHLNQIESYLEEIKPVKSFLNTSQITNCILEAPQMVDLELNDGVLTLKAGSKAIVPYGTSAPELNIGDPLNGGEIVDISWDGEKLFYIVQYDDLSLANTSEQNANFNLFVKANGSIGAIGSKAFYSSDTQPCASGRYFWYDTTNNICKFYTGSELISYPSFPFVEIVNNSTGFASIKQVFQSIGFIGSTVWTNKGVKALAPNGKNEDGTLKNTEITSDYVFVNTTARNLANSKLRFYPTGLGMGITNYDNIDNVNRNNDGNIKANCALICAFDENQTLINNFTPKSVFQAVDNSMVEYKTFPTSNLKILDLNSPAVGSYQINLSNILPKDGYNYDLFVEMRCDTSNDTSVNDRVIRMFCSENDRTNSTNIIGYWCQDGTNQSFGCTQFIPLLYGARMLYLDISGTNSKTFANVDIDLLAYRKRGQ